jgi:hypothetical protein
VLALAKAGTKAVFVADEPTNLMVMAAAEL